MIDQIEEERLKRADVYFATWVAGVVLVLAVLAAYLMTPPLTLARLGEVAGVVGFVLLVASMLLMLRLPGLAAAVGGLEMLYTLHRNVGLAAYGCMLLHPLLMAQQGGWTALDIEGKSFGFTMGWAGLLILMVVLTSTFLLKVNGYLLWRRLHTFTVAAFFAIAVHVAMSQDDWPMLVRVVFGGVILAGLLAPVIRFWVIDGGGASTRYRVEQVSSPADEVIDMRLAPVGVALNVQPGQFVFARFHSAKGYRDCGHFHPFTARGMMDDGTLRLSIKSGGDCTPNMRHIPPGTKVRLQGPYGSLFQNLRGNTQVWVAGGFGFAAFVDRVRALDSNHAPVRLFYFFNSVDEAEGLSQLEALANTRPNLKFHPVATHGSGDAIESIFDALLPPWNDKHYRICGSDQFVQSLSEYLRRHGVRSDAIVQEYLGPR